MICSLNYEPPTNNFNYNSLGVQGCTRGFLRFNQVRLGIAMKIFELKSKMEKMTN